MKKHLAVPTERIDVILDTDTCLPDYDRHCEKTPLPKPMTYIYDIAKDALFRNLAKKLTENA